MKIGFTVSDIQDFHLYGFLLEMYIRSGKNVILLYDMEVAKVTSPKKNKKHISQFECEKAGYKSKDQCIEMSKGCDVVITNEGQPFQGKTQLPFKMVALSWTMEYYVHGPRFLHLTNRFYVDCSFEQLKKTYDLTGHNVIYEKHPKYYMLNGKSKADVCNILGLDPDKKYVTFLGPAPAQHADRKIKDMYRLGKMFKSMGYTLIVKQKPKCPDLIKICDYDIVFLHQHKIYSTSAMLTYVSDFMVGFNTSGVVESARTNTPFVNLYLDHKTCNYRKHPVSKIIYDKLLRIDDFNEKTILPFVEKNQKVLKRTDFEMDSFFAGL